MSYDPEKPLEEIREFTKECAREAKKLLGCDLIDVYEKHLEICRETSSILRDSQTGKSHF